MGWLIKNPAVHVCRPPQITADEVSDGDVWKCDECPEQFAVRKLGDRYSKAHVTWRKLKLEERIPDEEPPEE